MLIRRKSSFEKQCSCEEQCSCEGQCSFEEQCSGDEQYSCEEQRSCQEQCSCEEQCSLLIVRNYAGYRPLVEQFSIWPFHLFPSQTRRHVFPVWLHPMMIPSVSRTIQPLRGDSRIEHPIATRPIPYNR